MSQPWVKYLKVSGRIADKAAFTAWEDGRCTTDQAITRMKVNNNIPNYMIIDREEFRQWLNSLGYRRRVNG